MQVLILRFGFIFRKLPKINTDFLPPSPTVQEGISGSMQNRTETFSVRSVFLHSGCPAMAVCPNL